MDHEAEGDIGPGRGRVLWFECMKGWGSLLMNVVGFLRPVRSGWKKTSTGRSTAQANILTSGVALTNA